MLKIAVVGVGWAGSRQVQAVGELGRKVEVCCLVDNDAEFLSEKRAELGVATTFTNYQEMLAQPHVDAVSICTPHSLHCEQTLLAIQAHKHVLVEKPMATDVADATRMVEAAEAAGVCLYVAESSTYVPLADALRDIVRSGRHIGEVTAASFAMGFRAPDFGYAGRRDWLTRPGKGGTGTWMLQGIHSMAQLRYIFGEVKTVYLQKHHASSFQRPDIEATMSGVLVTEDGVCISVLQTCESRLFDDLEGYVIHGDQGSLRACESWYEVYTAASRVRERHDLPAEKPSRYAREIEAFADTISGHAAGPTTGVSERRTLAIVEAGYESARSGEPVDLEKRFGRL